MDPNLFSYEPLDLEGDAFRVLILFKGEEGSDIECKLFQTWLHGDRLYEALSYTWGSSEMTEIMKVNGKVLRITERLHLALKYLRSPVEDRVLWVDAVCIDQSNEKERGHQVQRMRDIYNQANGVIFWLGLAAETNVIMDSLYHLEQKSLEYAHRDWKTCDDRWKYLWSSIQPELKERYFNLESRQRAGIDNLLRRPWFKRVWILQEVASAKKASIYVGDRKVAARIFSLAPSLLEIEVEPHCQAVLDIMPGSTRTGSWWNQKRDLHTLLLKFTESEASDPRDKIFALLGISSDAKDLDIRRPDYTKPEREVIRDTSTLLFCMSKDTCDTVQGFMVSLNQTYLHHVAGAGNASAVASHLKQRGDYVKITEETVTAAAGNTESGKEVLEYLLEQRGDEVSVTQRVLQAAAGNSSGEEIMGLLLQYKRGTVVSEAVQSRQEILELLIESGRGEVNLMQEVVEVAADNSTGKDILGHLLKHRGGEFSITEEVVIASVKNIKSGKEMIELLLTQRGGQFKITANVVIAAVGNPVSGKEVIELLLKHRRSDFKVTSQIIRAAHTNENERCREDIVDLLERRREAQLSIWKKYFWRHALSFQVVGYLWYITKRNSYKKESIRRSMAKS